VNILFYTKEFPPEVGGIETYTYNVAKRFHQFGHNVVVVVRHMDGDEEFDRQQSFEVVRLRKPFRPASVYRLYTFLRVPWLIRKYKADCVYLPYWFRFSSVVSHLNRLLGLKYFVTCYGEEVAFAHRRRHHSHTRLLKGFKRAERIFSISEHTKKLLCDLGIDEAKISVVRPGIDISNGKLEPAARENLNRMFNLRGKTVAITVSRLVKKKGHDNVLRALSVVRERHPEVLYLIIGEGEEEQNLRSLARELGVGDRVIFMGRVDDDTLRACYAACDFLIMTTREVNETARTEGFGIVYLEANLFSKPVIAGRVGGVHDAVVDGVTGILVDPCDVADISRAMDTLLSDPELRKRLGENGRRRALDEFSWDTAARRIEELMLAELTPDASNPAGMCAR
jgi:phosphatidylinositol alpha-1,6-mannosyltransferase